MDLRCLLDDVGFPKKKIEHILDPSAEFAYRIESALLESIPQDLVELTGIHVEQRGVGTILREAKKNNDDWTMTAMINPEKKVRHATTRVEMRIETLSVDGKVSACAEQVGPLKSIVLRWSIFFKNGEYVDDTYL